MHEKKTAFIKILVVELKDLEADIELIIEEYQEKMDNDEVSQYVFLENLAVLKNEFFGVEGFAKELLLIDTNDYESVDDLKNELLKKLKEIIKVKGLAQSLIGLIDRKMNKVLKYVSS